MNRTRIVTVVGPRRFKPRRAVAFVAGGGQCAPREMIDRILDDARDYRYETRLSYLEKELYESYTRKHCGA